MKDKDYSWYFGNVEDNTNNADYSWYYISDERKKGTNYEPKWW